MADFLPENEDPRRSRLQLRVFLCSNFVYLWLVHGWGLWLYPLGTDYVRLAEPAQLPFIAGRVLGLQLHVFGDWLPGYHAFNFMLLYGAMLAVLFLTRFVLNGPWWLGSLAAVLTMANPAKSAGVLPLSASADLLSAVFALTALACYAGHLRHGGRLSLSAALGIFAVASLGFADNVMLFGALLALDWLMPQEGGRRLARLAPFALLFAASAVRHDWVFLEYPWDPIASFAPLYLAFYPMGLLPETALWYEAYPALWLMPLVALGGAVYSAYRATGERGILAGVLAAVAFRAAPQGGFDFVHLWGGGQLIVPIALMSLALAGVWMHVQRHPKWKRSAVSLTTTLCLVFFLLQVREILSWRAAGEETQLFQERAAATHAIEPGVPIAVMPVFGYWGTVPMWLSESVAHDTPFSMALPVERFLRMHYAPPGALDVEVLEWNELSGVVRLTGQPADALFGPDMAAPAEGESMEFPDYLARFEAVAERDYTIRIFPVNGFLPVRIVPYGNRGAGLGEVAVDAQE